MRGFTLTFLGVIFGCLAAFGQQSVPVFRNPKDSVDYVMLQRDLSVVRMLLAASAQPQRDSLLKVQDRLLGEYMHLMGTGAFKMRTVYIPNPGLTKYDDFTRGGTPEKVRTLSVSGEGRKRLPDSVFLCTNLEELELVNWKLNRLPRQLKQLGQLKELTILNNQPSSPLRLTRSKSIKELNIRGDDGNGRLPRNYRKLRNLETLDVSRNSLTAFPGISGCRRLTKLEAMFNDLTLEDLSSRQPKTLVTVNLSNNKIKAVPPAISGFENVKKLNFNNNQIEVVSENVSSLKQLEEVSFYKNKLKSIPASVYELPNLKVIDLYFNEIEKADVRLGQMQSLEVLYLANNRIYSLPDNLGQLPHLRELYLHNNRISNLPTSVGSLHQLTVLRVNNNSILEFPPFLFELEKLQNLDVSNNQITTLDFDHFRYKELKILVLVGNPWDVPTREALPALAEKLRTNYKTVVHLNSYSDVVE